MGAPSEILDEGRNDRLLQDIFLESIVIENELRKFCRLPDEICHAVDLLENARPYLQIIKARLGAENACYLDISTRIVRNALHNLVSEVNETLLYGKKMSDFQCVVPVLRAAWETTILMDDFDMEPAYRSGSYEQYRRTLMEICKQTGIRIDAENVSHFADSGKHRKIAKVVLVVFILLLVLLLLLLL